MCKFNPKNDSRRIDPCIRDFIKWLNNKHKTILSCCGHGKYPMSVIVKEYTELKGQRAIVFREIISGMILRVKENALDKDPKKFYKKDKQGVYYIPEIIEQLNRKGAKLKWIV